MGSLWRNLKKAVPTTLPIQKNKFNRIECINPKKTGVTAYKQVKLFFLEAAGYTSYKVGLRYILQSQKVWYLENQLKKQVRPKRAGVAAYKQVKKVFLRSLGLNIT